MDTTDPLIRTVLPAEIPAIVELDGVAFGYDAREAPVEDTLRVLDPERTLAVFDGPQPVGSTACYTFELSVPGASLPCAGVTWVAVRPTHRRRGILRTMMRRQLDDIRERGEPIAALWASESLIYSRFGYGLAAEDIEFSIDRRHTTLAHRTPSSGQLRMADRAAALEHWPSLYERARQQQPGMPSRTPAWWETRVLPPDDSPRTRGSAIFNVQYEDGGTPLGYLRYEIRSHWEDGLPAGTAIVHELLALDPASYAALWEFAFSIDLVQTITGQHRPVDDPIAVMLADPRRMKRVTRDSLWLRIIDVERALAGRRYAREERLVLAVQDPFCDWITGTWAIHGGPDGAECRATTESPDIELSASDLGAVYLGAASFRTLARAGRLSGQPEALHRADAMFNWHPAP